jgi:hypothetical protein
MVRKSQVKEENMSVIHCKAEPFKIDSWTILRLPESASSKLPSRGMTMVEGTINGYDFQAALEPDGKKSHWFRIDEAIQKAANATAGNVVTLEIEPLKKWPEPEMPDDLEEALAADPRAYDLWKDTTTKARWDWIRWIRSTKNPETRKGRIGKTRSKLKSGKRRPCCFNRSLCTVPSVSKSGVLLDPT